MGVGGSRDIIVSASALPPKPSRTDVTSNGQSVTSNDQFTPSTSRVEENASQDNQDRSASHVDQTIASRDDGQSNPSQECSFGVHEYEVSSLLSNSHDFSQIGVSDLATVQEDSGLGVVSSTTDTHRGQLIHDNGRGSKNEDEKEDEGEGEEEEEEEEEEEVENASVIIHNYSKNDTVRATRNVKKNTNETQDGQRSSQRVKSKEISMQNQTQHNNGLDEELEKLRRIPSNYPHPRPARNSKANIVYNVRFEEPDNRAKQVKADAVATIDELVLELTNGLTLDIHKVRVLLTWIGYQTKGPVTRKLDGTSPMTYLNLLRSGKITHSALFAILCREANIPCVLVEGLAKGQDYDVGNENVAIHTSTWTAVYVSEGWRLVFPLWALTDEAGECENVAIGPSSTGVLNEFYFLTDPGEFIYRCLPSIPTWQLLHHPISREQFKRLPYISSKFFESYICLSSTQHGVIQANVGHCRVCLTQRKEIDAELLSHLKFDSNISQMKLPASVQLNKYTAIIHNNKTWRVNIRLPYNGVYKLIISDSKRGWLCSFRIVCEKACATTIKAGFPEHPALGFGPCRQTLEAGIIPISHICGVIRTRMNQQVDITFDLTADLYFQIKCFDNESELEQCASHRVQNKELSVTVRVPFQGEYSVVIMCKGHNSNDQYTVGCSYLLTTENINKRDRTMENPVDRKARARLVFVTQKTNNPEVIQKALNEFHQMNLQCTGEVRPATEKLNFLRIRKDLTDGIARKNKHLLVTAIAQARSNEDYIDKLMPTVTEAEECLSRLPCAPFKHSVLSMGRRTTSEISSYKYPRPLIHDVMKATLVLLGERPADVQIWPNIQRHIMKSGKHGFLNRIKQFDVSNVSRQNAKLAQTLVSRYDKESAIEGGSAGVGTFYVWDTSWRVSHVEQEVLTCPEHLMSPSVFVKVTDVTDRVLGKESS